MATGEKVVFPIERTEPTDQGEPTDPATPTKLTRRRLLQSAALVGAAGALSVTPLEFAAAADGEQTRVIEGRLDPGAPD